MFGIGATEFIFILVVLLLVVGPERLPGLARQAGQTLVRVRNWVQASPDAAMIMRARAEIEQELSQLKLSLAEVQNVRDQVVEAAKQVQQTVQDDVIAPTQQIGQTFRDEVSGVRQQAQSVLNSAQPGTETTTAAAEASGDAAQVAATAADTATEAAEIAVDAAQQALEAVQQIKDTASADGAANVAELPVINPVPLNAMNGAADTATNGQTVVRARTRGEAHRSTVAQAAQPTNGDADTPVSAAAFAQLQQQIAELLRDVTALRAELHQRGVLDDHTDDLRGEPVLATKGKNDVHE